MCVARNLGSKYDYYFLTIFSNFSRSDDQDLLDDDQSNFDSQEQESQAWKKETFDWLYSNYYYYIFLQSVMMSHMKFFDPNLFFYVEARDSKQKTQKNLKKMTIQEEIFEFFFTKNFLMSVN